MLETFTAQTFAPLMGQAFQVVPGAGAPIRLDLFEVTELGDGAALAPTGTGAPRRPFSLLFHGPRDVLLPQRIYRLEHATLGAFDLFIVPIGPDAQGLRYEAIFT